MSDQMESHSSWPSVRLKFAAPLRNERMSAGAGHPDYVGMENIQSWTGKLVESAAKGNENPGEEAGLANIFRDGDVLFGKLRPYLAKAYHVERTGVCSTELLVMQPSSSLYGRFFLYSLLTDIFVDTVDASTFGAKMPRASWEFIGSLSLRIPSIRVQIAIASFLDQETLRIDTLISEKEKMLSLLEEKRIALISRVVTQGLDSTASLKSSGHAWVGEVPAHWEVWRLKHLADVRGGLTLGKQYGSSELHAYPYLRVANVQDGFLALNNVLTVEVPSPEADANLLAYGDVLMNEGGDIDKLGRGCVWRDEIKPCLHQNHVFAVRPHSVDSEWLALWTSTLEAKRYFEMRAKRSTNLASISGSNIKELAVPIPPVAEQQAIKRHLDAAAVRTEAIRKELAESISLLRERRAALITDAVTGKIPLEEMTA